MWRSRKVSSSLDATTWFDAIRTFAPGPKKFALALVCLQTVAGALMVSTSLAFAMVVALAATLVKIYEVDTEPVILMMTHTIISGCMLYDLTTTAAVIVVVVAAAVTFGAYDLPQERVIVFVSSSAVAVLFGYTRVFAVVISMVIAVVIVLTKLRPVQPSTLTLLTLGLLALSLLIDRIVGNLVLFLIIAIVTALFVVNRITNSDGMSSSKGFGFSKSSVKNTSNNNNTNITNHNSNSNAVPNGFLQLASPCDSLDLHGHTVTGAIRVLNTFLRESEDAYRENRTNHLRHVTIITGEGNPIDLHGPAPLLKPSVINFLKINKYKYETPSTTPGLIRVDLESHVI